MAQLGREPLLHLSTQQLEYLVEVEDNPTWADAAKALGVTPSALSQGLSQMERRVGVPLFDRRGRGRILTASGEEVLRYARDVVARTRQLSRWAVDVGEGSAGRLRVGMIDIAAITFFGGELKQFLRQFPDLGFHLEVSGSAALCSQVHSGHLDLAVVVEPSVNSGRLSLVRLLEDELAIYAPEGADIGTPQTWGPWVTFPPQSHTRALIARTLEEKGIRFDVVAESHQPEVLRGMVKLGLGWTVLPVRQAETAPGALVRAQRDPVASRRLVVARRYDNPVDNPAADALVQLLALASESVCGGGAMVADT